MSLVAFVSGRSRGLTTAVHAIAAAWPDHRQSILAELDPAGGSLAARHELAAEPGLTNLAAAGRRGLHPETVLHHCRRLPSGVVALIAPVSPDRVASALSVLGPDLAEALASIPGTDVLADCGRIDRRSPALELVRAAPYVVLLVTPSLEGVAHAQARVEILGLPPGQLAAVTIGARPYEPDEVGAALELPVLGALAHDSAAATQLNGGRPGKSDLSRRGDLRRSAGAIAARLAGFLPSLAIPGRAAPAPETTSAAIADPGAAPVAASDGLHPGQQPAWADPAAHQGPHPAAVAGAPRSRR